MGKGGGGRRKQRQMRETRLGMDEGGGLKAQDVITKIENNTEEQPWEGRDGRAAR